MPDLSTIPDHELVAELERRGAFSRFAQALAGFFRVPTPSPVVVPSQIKPPVPPPSFFPGTDRRTPKGTVALEEVPGRANKDGSQLRVATISPDLQARLTCRSDNLRNPGQEDPLAYGPGGTRTIVRGDDRRALAQSFIDEWKKEIAELEQRLAEEVLDQDQIEAIHGQIQTLYRQIEIRSESAFGGPSYEEVMAKNAADNGPASLERVEPRPGTPGVGLKWDFPTGIDAIDHPLRLSWDVQERPEVLVRLKAILPQDPCLGHLDRPVVFGESGATTSLRILADPLVFMRLMAALEQVYQELRVDVSKSKLLATIWDLGQAALSAATDVPPGPRLVGMTSVAFCREWTGYLRFRLQQEVESHPSDDHTYRSIKRQIRIWNPDFQEKDAPDFMFEAAVPEGIVARAVDDGPVRVTESRPHVNPNEAWKEVPAGPGVFKMSLPEGRVPKRRS